MAREPINRDGGQWRLTWEREASGGYRAWVVSHPDVSVTGSTWLHVREALHTRINNELHAGEWAADWFPPEPCDEDPRFWTDQTFVMLVGDGRHVAFNDPLTLYHGGVCACCVRPLGPRTDVPITTHVDLIAGIACAWISSKVHIWRENAYGALDPSQLAGTEVRRVNRVGRGIVKFVELIPSATVKTVAMAQPAEYHGGQCGLCGGRGFSHRFNQNQYRSFIPASSIPSGVASFWIDDHGAHLCVRQDWWRTQRTRPEFRGIISQPVYVLRDDAIKHTPSLRVRDPSDAGRSSYAQRLRTWIKFNDLKVPLDIGGWLDSI